MRNAFVCPDVFMEPVLKPLNVLVMMDMREWFAINVWKILPSDITNKLITPNIRHVILILILKSIHDILATCDDCIHGDCVAPNVCA